MYPQTGKKYQGEFTQSAVFPGTVHEYILYLPPDGAVQGKNGDVLPGLVVTQDGTDFSGVMAKLAMEKAMPFCVGLFVFPGEIKPLPAGGENRSNRSPEYDGLGSDYADFIIGELLPYLQKEYDFGISPDPELHLIAGCSSGGIAAWNAAWERNDFFRRCYINSPTFCAFRGGDIFPALIRKYERRKIRCYITFGTDDMRNSGGDWELEGRRAVAALKYAGYEFEYEVFDGGEHGCGYNDPEVMERALRFCWQNWGKIPAGAGADPDKPPRVAELVDSNFPWREVEEDCPVPEALTAAGGVYFLKKDKIYFAGHGGNVQVAAELPGMGGGLALSSDRCRLYVSISGRRYVWAYRIAEDGKISDPVKFARLELADDCREIGAKALAVDEQDRLYAATELGIQTFSSQSEHNTILPLPENLPVDEIVFGGKDCRVLTARSGGRVFQREMKIAGVQAGAEPLKPATEPF